ncbi:MAG TPA: 50S ribosomal protein L19 [Candidatus Saccharimonadales bacterium]|nr:50S ribosomal protein L19 [Candidatus Saccharimonadales bacterium]
MALAIDPKAPNFKVGDIIRVATKDPQENKVHANTFEGIVISLRGEGTDTTFIVRKISYDKVAVERIFPINSPYIQSVTVIKSTPVRRAKLYYLRTKKNS